VSTWLGAAQPTEIGLAIPRGPHAKGADLLLGVEQVVAHAGEVAARLEWDRFVSGRRGFGAGEAWTLGPWGSSKSGSLGMGIDGGPSLDPVRQVASGRLSQLAAKGPYLVGAELTEFPVLPLWAPQYRHAWQDGQLAVVKALLLLLRDRPELRTKLADTSVVSELLQGMQRELGPQQALEGLTSSTNAVGRALTASGYAFHYGRPLPGDKLEPAGDVVDKVWARAGGGPGKAASIDFGKLQEVVRTQYAAVDPWPFQALGV
jgi:hypothetical protein